MTEGLLNVPAAVFRRWMQEAGQDPEIRPARVIYPAPASAEELAQLKAERRRHDNKSYARVVSLRLLDRTGSTAASNRR